MLLTVEVLALRRKAPWVPKSHQRTALGTSPFPKKPERYVIPGRSEVRYLPISHWMLSVLTQLRVLTR